MYSRKKVSILLLCLLMLAYLFAGCKKMERHRKTVPKRGQSSHLYVSDRLRREAVDPELMKEVEKYIEEKTNVKEK